ncbi:MAG: sigma-70 family RNA polymerase sigma factor [Verrucomicrobia bacterium]|nr:sigma-70 family RNA polymerase sigma factor [Verrucomicrobiota bacterium]
MRTDDPSPAHQAHGCVFATTHWSVVLAAGDRTSPQATEALEKLCRTYWYPLYAYVRRRGYGHDDAQDLTQAFLFQLLQRRSFARADRSRGRLRSFLLGGLYYFLADEHERANAGKRGGRQPVLSFDALAAHERYGLEPVDQRSPDRLFERQWALTVLDRVLARLEGEFREAGKADLFQRLREFLVAGTADETYADAAAGLGMSRDAVKKAVHRLRRRYHELFCEEIAQTVADPAEVEDELRHLCAVMAG